MGFETEVSGPPIDPTFKVQDVQEAWPLKTGRRGSSETSVLNHLTPLNNPEKGRIRQMLAAIQKIFQRAFRYQECNNFVFRPSANYNVVN
jgi:hypothetical protein